MSNLLRQGDPQWSDLRIDPKDSMSTLGRIGCAFICLNQLALHYKTTTKTPDLLLPEARALGCFIGRQMVWSKAGDLMGLKVNTSTWIRNSSNLESLRNVILQQIQMDQPPLVHVSYSGSTTQGDHWLVVIDQMSTPETSYLLCVDPATGDTCKLNPETLIGKGPKALTYTVVGVIPVSKKVTP